MAIRYVEEVKQSLGDSTLQLLNTLFIEADGLPPVVRAKRFRAKHREWMDELSRMGHSQWLVKWDQAADTYRVSGYALPLILSDRAPLLLNCMDRVFAHLRSHYEQHLDLPITTKDLVEAINCQGCLLREALWYMRDIDGWWSGLGNEFPADEGATVIVYERILNDPSLGSLLERVYKTHVPVNLDSGLGIDLVKEATNEVGIPTTRDLPWLDLLHPSIRDNALKLYQNGHLREAVLNAIVAVFDLIRARTGVSDDGDRLINQVFSLDDPFLQLSDLSSESGLSDQKGFMQVFRGAYQGIRNTKAHSLAHDLTEHKAAQYLVFASLLACRIDEATVVRRAEPSSESR